MTPATRPDNSTSAPPVALLAAALTCCAWVAAASPVDPFFAQVPVADTGEAARAAGYREALARVLIKFSGDPAAVAALATSPGLGPADPLVRQHRYLEAPPGPDQLAPQTLLEVRFNPTRIRDRARELKLPVWPLERPAALIWVALERSDRQRSLLGTAAEDASALAAIESAARERALPIVLPLMDLEDQVAVRVADVWAGYGDRIGATAARYAAPLLLLGRGYSSAVGWSTQWFLSGGGVDARWESEAATLEQALSAGVNALADRLGRRFAVNPADSDPQRVVVRVFGIEDMARFGAVIAYLKSLSMVTRAEPYVVAPGYVDFTLTSDAGIQGLAAALEFGRVLSRVDQRLIAGAEVDLTYRVVP